MAAGQCTMNNFTFGNERHQYYETISGGSGAGDRASTAPSVVQTHMTNSRLTDPEVLEFRFPVRLEATRSARGSGGAGRWRGGDGGVRRVRFLEPMTASILVQRPRRAAFGMAGGQPGALGHQPGRAGRRRAVERSATSARPRWRGRRVRDRDAGRRRLGVDEGAFVLRNGRLERGPGSSACFLTGSWIGWTPISRACWPRRWKSSPSWRRSPRRC